MGKAKITKRIDTRYRFYTIDKVIDRGGSPYISISEIPTKKNPMTRKISRILLFPENVEKFIEALREVADTFKEEGTER